jgi:glycosyltransferase involved in cell wall biosynthesis
MVEDYARQHPHRRVAIKLHPASRAYGFSPPPIRHAHIVTADSLALIRSARVVLVVASTTGIEAMSLGRPVLQVPLRGYVGPTEFIGESGAARRVDSVEELTAATEHLLSDRSAYRDASERGRAYARSFIQGFGQPGGAVLRLADLVAELRHS